MADKIKLLELDIDVEAIIAKSSQLKSQLDQLRENQDKLKKSGDTSSETYVKNAATIAKVSSEYNKNQQQLTNLSNVSGKYLTVQEKLKNAVDKEITSITAARSNNTELLKVRNELNLKTEDGARAAAEINAKLDQNNKFIKENVSQYEQQKIGIGDYASGIREAIGDTGLFSGELATLSKSLTALTGPFKLLKDDFMETASRMKNAGTESEGLAGSQKALAVATNIGTGAMRIFTLALAATGIGLIIIAIALLIGYFKTFDPIVDKIEQAIAGMGAAVRVVQQALADFLTGITSVGDAISKLGNFLAHPIDSLKSLGKEMAAAANAAATLKEAQQDLADSQAIQSVLNKKQEAEIARLMLQSKDRGKTEAERIALLQKAEQLNAQNYKANAGLAEKESAQAVENARIKGALTDQEVANLQKVGIAYAYKLLNLGKITQDEVDLLTKAEESKIEIYNRSTAEQEKIQNKQNALIEKQEAAAEAAAKKAQEERQKALDYAVTKSKSELDLFISQQGFKAKSLQEELALAEKVRDKKLQIAQQEYNASKKTEADKNKLLTDSNNIKEAFLKQQSETAVANAERELGIIISNNDKILDNDKFLSEALLAQKKQALENELKARREFEKTKLNEGIINEQTYNDAINLINDENRVRLEELEAERKAAAEEAAEIDVQNKRDGDLVNRDYDLEFQLNAFDEETARLRKKAEEAGANMDLFDKKRAKERIAVEKAVNDNKLQLASQTFGNLVTLLGRESEAGKAAAIAQATIDTYLAAVKAYQSLSGIPIVGPALGALAAGVAVAAGLANVKKIMSTDASVKMARGGILKGPPHVHGGIKTSFGELEGEEIVINKNSSKMFAPLLSAINVAGGGVAFAKGEIPYPIAEKNVYSPTVQNNGIDYDLLAGKIAEANMSLPAPVVFTAIEEINNGQQNYARVVEAANL